MPDSQPPPLASSGVALPLARIVFNPATCLLGGVIAFAFRALAAILGPIPPAPAGAGRGALARAAEVPLATTLPALLASAGLFAFLGVAIARIAAVKVCRGETLGPAKAVAFAFRQWLSGALYPMALLVSVVGTLALAGGLGLLAQIPFFGPLALVALYPIAILLGVLAALVATLGSLAAPSVAAALAVERSGTLDALSRSFSYAFTRPAPFLFYSALVALLAVAVYGVGTLGLAAADEGLAFLLRGETLEAILRAARAEAPLPDDPRFTPTLAAAALRGIRFAAEALVLGAAIAVVFSGGVAIYLTLRRDVDGVPLGEMELTHPPAPAGATERNRLS